MVVSFKNQATDSQRWKLKFTGWGKDGKNIIPGNDYISLQTCMGKFLCSQTNGVAIANRDQVSL